MKTFAVMFTILAILNVPIYIIYMSSTNDNKLMDINHLFKYFTLGNMGRPQLYCDYSDLKSNLVEDYEKGSRIMDLHCDGGRITSI